MATVKTWIKTARLRTLPLSLSGIIVGSAIAYSEGIFNTSIFLLALLTTLLFQVLSNYANDYGDAVKGTDNDDRVGPKRALQAGDISLPQMKAAILILSVLSIISSIGLIAVSSTGKNAFFWIFYIFLAVFCVIAAITYTVGKKAYGYHGLGDVFVFIFFGWVSVVGVYHLYPEALSFETIQWQLFLLGATIGFLSAAVLNLNNMRDRLNDEKSGKHTLVVKLGFQKAKEYHQLLVTSSFLTLFVYLIYYVQANYFMFSIFIPIFILVRHLRQVKRVKKEQEFDPYLKVVSLSTFLLSALFFISLILKDVAF